MIAGFTPRAELDWQSAVLEGPALSRDAPRGGLALLLAGGGPNYSARMQAIDWSALYEQGLGDAIEAMRDAWVQRYDFVLVDSRTGLNDMAGICTIQLPDVLVLVGTASQQSLDGLQEIMGMVERGRDALPYERAAVHLLPVLGRFEARVEHALAKRWSERWIEAMRPAFDSWLHADTPPARIAPRLRVPHVAYWGFGEGLPVDSEDRSDPESIAYSINLAVLDNGEVKHRGPLGRLQLSLQEAELTWLPACGLRKDAPSSKTEGLPTFDVFAGPNFPFQVKSEKATLTFAGEHIVINGTRSAAQDRLPYTNIKQVHFTELHEVDDLVWSTTGRISVQLLDPHIDGATSTYTVDIELESGPRDDAVVLSGDDGLARAELEYLIRLFAHELGLAVQREPADP